MKLSWAWRLLALLVIIMLLGAFGLALIFVLQNILLSILVGLIFLVTIYSIWLIFTGHDKRWWVGTLLLLVCGGVLVAALIFARRSNETPFIITISLLLLGGAALANMLRLEYWRKRRRHAQNHIPKHEYQKPVLIINPKSGDGRATKAGIKELAKKQGIKVIVTKKGDDFSGLARQAVADGADILGASGGDGTLGAVAVVALENDLPMVVLPGGTRCHFARDIGLDPARIADALTGFNGVERKVDVGVINGRVFLNNASLGLYADIVDRPEYREHKLATTRKVLNELLSGERPADSLIFADNKGHKYYTATQILIGVNAYETMNLFELGHRQKLNEGILQVNAITKLDDSTVRRLLKTFTITKYLSKSPMLNFIQWTTKSFVVKSKAQKLVVGVDGEREEYTTPVKITLGPRKLRLMVPAEGVRPRPGQPFNRKTIGRLWRLVLGRQID